MLLKDLFKDIKFESNFDFSHIEIDDINCDTRVKSQNFLYFAIQGIEQDGHKYIQTALKNGAKVISGTLPYDELKNKYNIDNTLYIRILENDPREIWAKLCIKFFNYTPEKFKIIAVTGTDGKTTTTNILYNLILQSGKSVALFSTIGIYLNGNLVNTLTSHNTTPDSYIIHKYLHEFYKQDVEYIVLEASSYGFSQKRIFGMKFEAAAITNITHEHLEQHGTYRNYALAKAGILESANVAFYNPDEIKHNLDVFEHLQNIQKWSQDILKDIDLSHFESIFIGEYNKNNLAVALTLLNYINKNVFLANIQAKINALKAVNGRFNRVNNNLGINIIIDYAHTPYGLESLLKSVKELTNNRILCVFGCEGKRDIGKRDKMGFIAKDYVDIAYLSPVDPRDEDIEKINLDIKKGWDSNNRDGILKIFNDRKDAIYEALKDANKGDYVLLLGKGDETTMDLGNGAKPYFELDIVNELLESIYNKSI